MTPNTARQDRALPLLDQPRNNVVIENQKAKCKAQEVVGGEDEAQKGAFGAGRCEAKRSISHQD